MPQSLADTHLTTIVQDMTGPYYVRAGSSVIVGNGISHALSRDGWEPRATGNLLPEVHYMSDGSVVCEVTEQAPDGTFGGQYWLSVSAPNAKSQDGSELKERAVKTVKQKRQSQ